MFVRYPPGKIRFEGDRPVALLGGRVPASSFRLVELPLGMPTTSARTSRGTWALYPLGSEVLVVHPGGAVSGPPAEVAAEVGRLAAREGQGELDRQAAKTIQQLLTGDGADRAGPRRLGTRTWSIPAKAYWLSGPYNDHGRVHTASPERSGERRSVDRGMGGRTMHVGALPAGGRPSSSSQPRAWVRHASIPTRSPRHPRAAPTAKPTKEARRDEDHGHLQQLPA
jgi:hypothetical protein